MAAAAAAAQQGRSVFYVDTNASFSALRVLQFAGLSGDAVSKGCGWRSDPNNPASLFPQHRACVRCPRQRAAAFCVGHGATHLGAVAAGLCAFARSPATANPRMRTMRRNLF